MPMHRVQNKYYFLFVILLLTSCRKDLPLSENPFDAIDYGTSNVIKDSLDANGIVAIHRDILLPKCSTPGCHDGSFEPDFRTVMSSYSTLVYHPIIKNNPDNSFTYRVIPYDTSNSVLQKRLNWNTFANINDRMPQDNIGTGLPQEDLDRITAWIQNGAKDPEGYVSKLPNKQPFASYIWVIEGAENWTDIWLNPINQLSGKDNRVNNSWSEPFIVEENMWLFMIPNIKDDSTAIKDIQGVKLELSYDLEFNTTIHSYIGSYIPPSENGGDQWYFNFQLPHTLPTDTTLFLRVVMNDGDHTDNAYFPASFANEWDKKAASFIIKSMNN